MLKKTFFVTLAIFSLYSIYLNLGLVFRGDLARTIIIGTNIAIMIGYFTKQFWIRKTMIVYASLLIIGGGGVWLAAIFGVELPHSSELARRTIVFLIGCFFLYCSLVHKNWFLKTEDDNEI